MLKKTLPELSAILLTVLFTYASISKLLQYDTFKYQLGQSPFVTGYAGIVAWGIPAIELVTTALLMFPVTRMKGFYLSYGLLLLFTFYIYAILHYSYFIPCSCGGILSQMNWEQHLVFNIVFSLIALTGIFTFPFKQKA
ncbi:MauE/DoxX family redox-associated membrane protein [Chitinophaga sp. S165]|uniref:MauE/DoxX family redox-associated membrane protein n=1 Tax=Chitinophaga sp. S165 TaxID=2135462 RepID=UPI000D71665D|nr:MauE/DoxX family redox-associated membrane protein [Chitinophaga sp. S165]PWV48807.1 hypothetical protein C7475_10651 [Chitinophaga sp. S165]